MAEGKLLTQRRLKELFHYDVSSGIFTTIKRRGRIHAGFVSGCHSVGRNGYVRVIISVDNREYRAHRLAWLYVYGEWPSDEIDHINGVSTDNRIENLRLATRPQNSHNSRKPKTNKSGFKGVSWHAIGKKWQAHIKSNGKNHYLGLFSTAKQAHLAYIEAANRLNGEFARVA